MPPRGFHCDECGMCVARFEFHSKWMARCIGLFSLKLYALSHFYFFVLASLVFGGGMIWGMLQNRFFSGVFTLLLCKRKDFLFLCFASSSCLCSCRNIHAGAIADDMVVQIFGGHCVFDFEEQNLSRVGE